MIVCPYCATENDEHNATCKTCGANLTGAKFPTALPVGTLLQSGKYKIEKILGQGGFGITYKAFNTALGIPVVVKECHPMGASRTGTTLRPPGTMQRAEFLETRARFADEAKLVAQLTLNKPNANIVRVYDVFTENETEYYTMEFLEGKPLSKIIEERGTLPESEVIEIARQVIMALDDVHKAGLLHRDIKPDNIMMVARGAVLIDFGSARAFAAPGKQSIIVTPGYAPLEQYASEAKRGPFTDIYALAGTLYTALTGLEPVPATDRVSGTKQPSAKESNPKVSKGMSDVLMRAMAMKIDERPQTADQFLAELEKAVGGKGNTPSFQKTQQVSNNRTQTMPQNQGQGSNWLPNNAAPPVNNPNTPVFQGTPPANYNPKPPVQTKPTTSSVWEWAWIPYAILGAVFIASYLRWLGPFSQYGILVGLYGTVLLTAYIFLQWLLYTTPGRIVLLLIVGFVIAYSLGYIPKFF
jgi:serine/threonine-protein kinase